MTPQEITLFIYNLSLLPIVFFSVLFLILALINIFIGSPREKFRKLEELPFISVQIPTFNDPIAERCVKQCMNFDYPKDKYEIIIADDSTNEKTQNILRRYADENSSFVKYIHRSNRESFKAGALKNAMKITKGELIVIFDADWIPKRNFLRKIIGPFSDPKVAIVQTRQGVYNQKTNLITRFASYLLTIQHVIIMPISNRINCVFFCGTAGAIRKSAFLEAGGWNLNSITEDSDLTVNLLIKGYKSVYLDFETPSEVPDNFEGFIKQQMRWCYGNARVFFDNSFRILLNPGIKLRQRLIILYLTLGNLIAPVVVVMTFFGMSGWFLGDIKLFSFSDITKFLTTFAYTSGFMIMGIVALHRKKQLYEFPYLVLSSFTIGVVLAVANTIAFYRAVINKRLNWFCTPKVANDKFIDG